MRIAEVSISAYPVMKTLQTAPTTPDVGLTDAGSVGFNSLLIGRAPDSADVR